MPFRKAVLSLAVLLLASVPLALGQGTYTQIDVPGAISTIAYGIDKAGDIVGFYQGSVGVYYGFLLSGGSYTTIAYPGSTDTVLTGINNVGQIVGWINLASPQGFLYDVATQTFSTVSYPGALETLPNAINDGGTIAGQYNDFYDFGFTLTGVRYRQIVPKGSESTDVYGISFSGKLVGPANEAGRMVNFSFLHGTSEILTIPKATGAVVHGVNPAGTAFVGYYTPSSGVTAGFVYQNNPLTTLQFPGSTYTLATGINDAREVVGYFEDAGGIPHGFTWTLPADAGKK